MLQRRHRLDEDVPPLVVALEGQFREAKLPGELLGGMGDRAKFDR